MTAPNQKLREFIDELSGFTASCEECLKKLEQDPHGNKHLFEDFSEWMFTIRGTAQQLGLPSIAEIAGLGEEIALKGPSVEKGSQIKKCVGALWDTLTTVKYMLEHPNGSGKPEDSEERDILKNRLQSTLRALGGAREAFSQDDIEKLLKGSH